METPRSISSGPEDVANFVFTTEVKPCQEKLKTFARENRKAPTPTENILWQYLRGSKLGVKFRRQHAIDFFIVDFFCVAANLIVELDGEIHATPENAEYDLGRTFTLTELGCRELRFTNH